MTEARKVKWLCRDVGAMGPYVALCKSEPEFKAALRHLKITASSEWIRNEHSGATTHFFENATGLVSIVCIRPYAKRDPVEVTGLLVHEAVHIWQEYANYYGEKNPGQEQEAYAIQAIAQRLIADLRRKA